MLAAAYRNYITRVADMLGVELTDNERGYSFAPIKVIANSSPLFAHSVMPGPIHGIGSVGLLMRQTLPPANLAGGGYGCIGRFEEPGQRHQIGPSLWLTKLRCSSVTVEKVSLIRSVTQMMRPFKFKRES